MDCSKNSKLASYIGLAQRAGGVLYGEDIICERLSKAKVVLFDERCTEKYKSRLTAKLKNIPWFSVGGLREALHRNSVNAIAITNDSLASVIIEILR